MISVLKQQTFPSAHDSPISWIMSWVGSALLLSMRPLLHLQLAGRLAGRWLTYYPPTLWLTVGHYDKLSCESLGSPSCGLSSHSKLAWTQSYGGCSSSQRDFRKSQGAHWTSLLLHFYKLEKIKICYIFGREGRPSKREVIEIEREFIFWFTPPIQPVVETRQSLEPRPQGSASVGPRSSCHCFLPPRELINRK